MANTVVVLAYVGSNGREHGRATGRESAAGERRADAVFQYRRHCAQPESDAGAQLPRIPGSSRVRHGLRRQDARRPAMPDRDVHARDAGRKADRQSGDRRMSYAHLVQTGTAFAALANSRWNPNFANTTSGITDLDSQYDALQMGINRRMTSNLAAQLSYTYSKCTDISSGNWSQEGGTNILNPYDVTEDRGPCTFQLRHNLSTNAVYALPFTGNALVEGWQVSGIFYASSGGPFTDRRHSGAQQQPGRDREPRRLRARCAGL